ncbi:protoporphyrinogen oxidase [Nocardioides sp. TRM66260-LWL]|uniref:protoporphyrinogen oxidase n=1 Tax=Nocardioides sp. TRM66260-LWL TaxID=2874478 RepID=UPI001CC56E3F|nr:protoporphyrinogen oxidase [Nocardioides sp. TRM66260-LWL]MBZ5734413.1 protoporphyrinogen oxidase [Nocardioides sp. TRM66260-LWL]
MTQHRVAVVGGGIAGLTAARDLVDAGHAVVLLEESARTGGKIRRREVGGLLVDVGAEAMLNRRPEGVELAAGAGLDVVHPAIASSRIWTHRGLRRLPRTLMGVPLDVDDLADADVLSAEGLAHVRRERDLPASDVERDVSVGELVDRRFGSEVTDLLVEPLLGGVYAGHAREISARAAVPQLVAMAGAGSVLAQAPVAAASAATYQAPVFAGIEGGMGRLAEALTADLRARGVEVRTGTPVHALHPALDGHDLVSGPPHDRRRERFAGIVLATPSAPTARLLADVAPATAREIAALEAASVVVVTLVLRAADAPALATTDSSGFLVPPIEGRRIKASTFSFAKWSWVREAGRDADGPGGDLLVLRTSLGRHREDVAEQASDAELVAVSLLDLEAATGVRARPVDVHVQRWPRGLPQYAVGHLARVERIREGLHGVARLAVCGAAYDGVGIPAVVASAHRAAAEVASDLRTSPASA